MTALTYAQVGTAVAYYADHPAEIDERIAMHERTAEEREAAHRRQQEILTNSAKRSDCCRTLAG